MAGSHVFRTWAKTQNTIALSSAEAELYAIVKGNCEMLGMMTMYNDAGMDAQARLHVDASVAIGIAQR